MSSRNIFLDCLRSAAILLMAVFHLAYDLEAFYGFPIGYSEGAWHVLNVFTAALFITVAGWSAGAGLAKRHVRRGLKLLAAATLVSVATYIFDPGNYVRFGILHFLAATAFLSPVLVKADGKALLLLAFSSAVAGRFVPEIEAAGPWLLPFGIMPDGFASMDYYPLFPWLLFYIAGVLIGRAQGAPQVAEKRFLRVLALPGRYSLFIYLVHQPLILLVLAVILPK